MLKDYDLTLFDEVSSTMKTIKAVSKPAIHIAKSQTQGIGQYGRKWISQPEKGIYMSLKNHLNVDHETYLLGMAQLGALTMATVLNDMSFNVKLKWPNDLYLEDRKLGGIIVEIVEYEKKYCEYILGLGLNLESPKVLGNAIGLGEFGDKSIEPNTIINAFVDQWDSFVKAFAYDGLTSFQKVWQKYDYLATKMVTVKLDGKEAIGTSHGIDDIGQLIIKTTKGEYLLFNHQASIIKIS